MIMMMFSHGTTTTTTTGTTTTASSCLPSDCVQMVSNELTLRSLLHLCTACKQRSPTPAMLAIALQNSIPSLTGLPMDNPDPDFYLEIAKRWFDPTELTIEDKSNLYLRVHRFENQNGFFPLGTTDVYAPLSDVRWPCGLDFFVFKQISSLHCHILSNKRRKFVRGMMLEWRAHYYYERQLAPADFLKYGIFIDRIINILDHAHVLSYRCLTPGFSGSSFVGTDEHR